MGRSRLRQMGMLFKQRRTGERTMANHEEHEEHEGHEGHENDRPLTRPNDRAVQPPMPSPWLRMRHPSPLPPETESVITETIGCAIAVHRALVRVFSSEFIDERCT